MNSEKRQVWINKVRELDKNSTKKGPLAKKALLDKTTINSLAGQEVSSISIQDMGAIINCCKTQNKARSLRK